MATDFKHGGLKWVIEEIHETLKQARVHFESFVEDDEDSAQLQFCTTYLHQVSGSLSMLELGGATLLSEEMELLSQAIYDDKVARREDSFEVLMRALIQLPDYLERLQRGGRDLPMVLLPLLNDLRASRGENLLTEGAVFAADLSLDNISPEPDNGINPSELAKKIRHYYHLGLLGWYRESENTASIQKIKKVVVKLKESVKTPNFYQLFTLMEAFVDGLIGNGISSSASTKLLLGQADRYIKQLIDTGESTDVYSKSKEAELLSLKKNLLFYIAHSTSSNDAIEEIRRTYHLADMIPDEDELEDARASMGGANADLMETVTGVILTDLVTVKDQLDGFVRNVHDADGTLLAEGTEHRENLQLIIATMTQISDTLAMLGQNGPRNVLQEKIELLKSMLDAQKEPERSALMEVASALLFVESAVKEMGQGGLFTHSDEDETIDLSNIEMTDQEKNELVIAAIEEAKDELVKVKEGVVTLIDAFSNSNQLPENSEESVHMIADSLLSISGVLGILDKKEGSQLVKDCAAFIATKMIVNDDVISENEQHYLADAITAMEYHLDAVADKQQDLSIIESVAQSGVDQLLGRESSESDSDSDSELSKALADWMNDVRVTDSRENLLKAVISAAEQARFLQHEHAVEITQQMESMINLVGDNQNSLNDDISSTLRWAVKTLVRIAQKATEFKEAKLESNQESSEKKNTEQQEKLNESADFIITDVQNDTQDELLLVKDEAVEKQSQTQDVLEIQEDTINSEPDTVSGTPPSDLISPAIDYPDIKKLETSDDLDPEIMEIFIEEAQEELEKITQLYPQWKALQDDMQAVTEMRRSFHTLKGSGRLVGAYEMGEFAWAFESMLNQIIDKSISAQEVHFASLEAGIEMLPEIAKAFEEQRISNVDYSRIAAYAHLLSKGDVFDVNLLTATTIDELTSPALDSELENNVEHEHRVDLEGIELAAVETDQQHIDEIDGDEAGNEGIDLVLLEIFTNEALGHIKNIEQCIEQCHQKNDHCKPDELLMRSLHTLRGSAHMAEIHAIGNISEQMEKTVKTIAEKGQNLDPELVQLLEEICHFSTTVLKKLEVSPVLPEENQALENRISAKYDQVLELDNLLDSIEVSEEISISEERLKSDENEDKEEINRVELTQPDEDDSDTNVVELEANIDELESNAASEIIADEYDDELLQIFVEEGEELLKSSEKILYKFKKEGANKKALKRLLRDIHTLKGGARMAGVSAIGDLSHSFESKLEQFTQDDVLLSPDHIELLLQVQDTLSSMLDNLKNGEIVENTPDLISQIDNIQGEEKKDDSVESDVQKTVTKSDEKSTNKASTKQKQSLEEGDKGQNAELYDDDLLEIFLEEAQELMDSSDISLSKLKNEPDNTEQLKQLLRDLHTLKGGARMAGITPVGDLAHSLETQLEKITNTSQVPNNQFFELLYQAHDRLNEMLDDLKTGKYVRSAEALIEKTEQFKQHENDDKASVVAVENDTDNIKRDNNNDVNERIERDSEIHEVEIHEVISDKSSSAQSLPEELPPESNLVVSNSNENIAPENIEFEGTTPNRRRTDQANIERGKTERVRVSADVLDELVNYAGEVSIYRGRLNQGSNEYQQSLDEMNSTILRMREQLRRFEMETEAQIQSRKDQAESLGYERYEEFDPLEFDRFSNMQQITRAMAESVADLDSIENTMINLNSESETLIVQQGRVNTDLQEGLMRTRMVPVNSQLTRFRRIVRQTSNELHKDVKFELHGGEQEIDRRVLEKMMAPLEHMLRNAIAHGIETPAARKKAGKQAKSALKLIFGRDGSEIEIKVVDDGTGININAVRDKAIEHGLMVKDAKLSDKDIIQFILESGFSTATAVSQIAGRGVGMDVVNTEIKQLNGTLEIDSELGKGSVFKVLMPLTMSVSRALMVEVGDEVFAIPLVGIENIIRESREVLEKLTSSNDTYYQWHDEHYQFMHLGSVLGVNSPILPGEKNKAPILLARSGEHRVAIFVDGLMGSREIVVKSVGPQLSTVKGVTGATILGDGKIALILDLGVLAREGAALKTTSEHEVEVLATEDFIPTVMVVDDSITVRKVTQRLLKR
ncbi:MAG: Hpt domain-containing protein [gamma proteobacterium symbiont of Bathyaustriella thionipta]|nr:Hpt domain-containing protein [gamma proteobacterium symbiont of Bathyaustriella thionipta]MCU7949982.1 Hpt domain-containing protein [gamma proteobacterium symbiont of Bathyaustriella thionipta]MCU7951854.1 Hpt domain-containing protein [gamma proteobacterium symbiont of Bathyaustriella thionipta]MCU7956564.1 Hpt domain-containing protein [gamma proteobacterium symbiont of Bathyaustriella thionipta]MCU7967387.1 Hpt domain-containing protein [gamma proteobacterium symbiont of Bathyaustriella